MNEDKKNNQASKKEALLNNGRLRFMLIQLLVVIAVIVAVIIIYSRDQRRMVINNAEHVSSQLVETIASNIASEIENAESSIKLASIMVSKSMTSRTLDNPEEIIGNIADSTPFDKIEYIREDGMNVMNIGEPFDASDRVYYQEGIKGNTGIWNNFHPRTSKETLMNFYTPLMYNGSVAGVITGYIATSRQISPLFDNKLYGRDVYGFLVDENNMVICSTTKRKYVPDLTLDEYLDSLTFSDEQKAYISGFIDNASLTAACFKDPEGEGRMCVALVPGTEWKVTVIVPERSFKAIINDNTFDAFIAISIISTVLILYAGYIIVYNIRQRKEVAKQNSKLEEAYRIFNEENELIYSQVAEIQDIIASTGMGIWHIELEDGKLPRMIVDDTMSLILGIRGELLSAEDIYTYWFSRVAPEAEESVLKSVELMKQGKYDENTYLWNHPVMGPRYVRCGGTAISIPGGFELRGYHYDVDDIVRKEQEQMRKLQEALQEKNDYYSTLDTLSDTFYTMHIVDLVENTVVEFNATYIVRNIVNHKDGAIDMMARVMSATVNDDYLEEALEFTDLTTLAERMKNKKIMSIELHGKNVGWFMASFYTMEADNEGRPTRVIFTTSVIDEEKKQKELLIKKSQTDELTGLYNRRAYEDDINSEEYQKAGDKLVLVSLDVNGLKVINDSKGHAAGDELIIGASRCMKKCLGSYGKIYRTGGDEFVAVLFCERNKLSDIFSDFDDTTMDWEGELVDNLSISYGWVCKEEDPTASIRQMEALADQRMYDAKTAHYKKTGVDRRGQQDAHKALCELYTKILKINMTNDSYQIINMNSDEQIEEKGFSNTISEWLRRFGESGQVHPDDLEDYLKHTNLEYMKDYFSGNKTSLHIFYRRRYGDIYKRVMMEAVPANDYSENNQSLFLYVKDIDK